RIIERTLRQLDRPQLQVAVDATVAEGTLNNQLNYGVQFFLKSSDVGLGQNKGSLLLTQSGSQAAAATTTTTTSAAGAATTAASSVVAPLISRVVPGFNFLVGTEATPRLIIDALQSVTDVKILSNPSLVVLDNHVATLQVGDQVPVTTQSAVAVQVATAPIVNNIDYKNTGIILRVQPRINVNGTV